MQGRGLQNDYGGRRIPPKETLYSKESRDPIRLLQIISVFHNRGWTSANPFETPLTRPNTTDAFMLLVHCTLYTPNRRARSSISYELKERRVLLVSTIENGIGVCHYTDSDAFYAVVSGNTGFASSVTTSFVPYYLDKTYRREDTPVLKQTM